METPLNVLAGASNAARTLWYWSPFSLHAWADRRWSEVISLGLFLVLVQHVQN